MAHQPLKHNENVFLLHKRHFAVDLGKFGLAVGAEVFVAEALHNLEIPVEPRHHQQLLEGLGRLRQGVKLAGVHAAWYHKIPRAFGR